MSINRIYHTWFYRILQLRPDKRVTRVRNFAWLLAGIFESKSVHLGKIASKIPGQAMLPSITRRLDRLLENTAIRVRDWYEPIAKELLERVTGQQISLIVDGSKVGCGHQLLNVSLAYRRRALPLLWTWVRHKRGHSSSRQQLALLGAVKRWLPDDADILLVGDSEFGAVEVLRQLESWGWKYVLRQKSNHLVRSSEQDSWKPLGDLITKAGQSLWVGRQQLTRRHVYPTNLIAHWQIGEKEPWLLATNRPSLHAALTAYRRRMWIEEMFGDLKRNGFDLESTRLRHFRKLSRLTLAVALLYLELITLGSRTIKSGQRRLVDRSDRRDLSIFRIGLYMLERLLTNSLPISIGLCPYFYPQTQTVR